MVKKGYNKILLINNQKYNVRSSKIKYVPSIYNKETYFSICVDINIELNKKMIFLVLYR